LRKKRIKRNKSALAEPSVRSVRLVFELQRGQYIAA